MTELFDRSWRLVVARRGEGESTGTAWSGLRVEASIKLSAESEPNTASIDVYNLSEASRALFDDEDAVVFLYAGHGADPPRVFVGDVERAESDRRGPDVVTTIEAGDGERAYNDVRVSISLQPGARLSQAFEIIATALRDQGVAVDPGLADTLPEVERAQGWSFTGRARNALTELCGVLGRKWSIQAGRLVLLDPDADESTQAVYLAPHTGLIGTPKRIRSTSRRRRRRKEWTVMAILQPGLTPGSWVRVESSTFDGFGVIGDVTIELDTHGNAWGVSMEVTERE